LNIDDVINQVNPSLATTTGIVTTGAISQGIYAALGGALPASMVAAWAAPACAVALFGWTVMDVYSRYKDPRNNLQTAIAINSFGGFYDISQPRRNRSLFYVGEYSVWSRTFCRFVVSLTLAMDGSVCISFRGYWQTLLALRFKKSHANGT
jgi:hypothetical protein